MIEYSYALQIAKLIIKNNPNYVLCGSTALILSKTMPKRKVNDLDFCCPSELFKLGTKQTYGDYGPMKNEGYLCYKITGDKGFYYNVFVHDKKFDLKITTVDGVKIQDPQQILKFKKEYNRTKDKEDFSRMKGH